MATEASVGLDFTWPVSGNLSTNQFCFVTMNSSGQLAVAGANVRAIGVLQDKPAATGLGGQVRCGGISKVIAGGSFNPGDLIASDASGHAVKYTAASVSAGTPEPLAGSIVLGIALAAGVSTQTTSILLVNGGLNN